MKRILLVAALATVLCLGITGLRVVLLQQMASPERPAPTPQRVDQPQRPPAARPAQYVATLPAPPAFGPGAAALLWRHTDPPGRD